MTMASDMMNIAMIVQTGVALVILAIFIMAIASFIMAGWDYITSKGEADKKEQLTNRIRFMLIGIVLIIAFLIFFPIVLKWLGVIDYAYFTAPAIFGRMGQILNYIFSIGGIVKDFTVQEGGFSPALPGSVGSHNATYYRL